MSDLFASTTPETEVTIPVEGVRRPAVMAGGVLPTERTAAVMVIGALVFLVFLRGAFKGALGD